MASRPRRSAAQKASEALTDWADSERTTSMSARTRRSDGRPSGVSRGPPSSPGNDHLNLTVKVPSNKLREATSGRNRNSGAGTIAVSTRESPSGGEIVASRRNRGSKKSYYIESESGDDEDEEMADLGDEQDDDDDMEVDADDDEEDAEGDDDDADGDVDMEAPPTSHSTIKIQNPKATPRRAAASRVIEEDDDDEEELSEIEVSDPEIVGDKSINVGGGDDDDDDEEEDEEDDDEGEEEEEDAEGEEDVEVEEDAEGEEDVEQGEEEDAAGEMDIEAQPGEPDDLDSDAETGSRAQTPDLSKMTRRQRARFEDEPQNYMKLSDEVQAKKVFTAEELSLRRQEMARRRRNLSDKRNEEVKMETINKLLKKQAPKTKGKGQGGDNNDGAQRPDPTIIRWKNTNQGSTLAVPEELVSGPAGRVFVKNGLASRKLAQEVN